MMSAYTRLLISNLFNTDFRNSNSKPLDVNPVTFYTNYVTSLFLKQKKTNKKRMKNILQVKNNR